MRTSLYLGVCMIFCLVFLAGCIAIGTIAPYLLVAILVICAAGVIAAVTDKEVMDLR